MQLTTPPPQPKYSISILYYLEHFWDFEALHGWRTVGVRFLVAHVIIFQ